MKREKVLIKNFGVISIGNLLPKFAAFITLPILTAGLTKAEYGTYDMISTLVSLILPIATLQVQSAAFRFLIECRADDDKSNSIITNLMVFTTLVSLLSLVVLYHCLYKLDLIMRIGISIYLFLDILMASLQQVVRGVGKNAYYSASAVLYTCVNTCMIVSTIHYGNRGLLGIVFSMNFSLLVGIIFLAIKLQIFQRIKLNLLSVYQLKGMLSYSWPMVPNNLSGWILQLSDRMVITIFLGIEANAVYAVANKIPQLLKLFQSSFLYVWQENASMVVHDDDKDAYYSRMFDVMLCVLGGLTALLLGIMSFLFSLLVKGDYEEAYFQMPILLLGLMFNCLSSFLGGIYIAHMKTKSVGITTVIAANINLAVCLLLINVAGIYAGSISTLVSYAMLMVYRMMNLRKFQRMEYNIQKLIVIILVLSVMGILSVRHIFLLDVVNLSIACTLFYLLNKRVISKICRVVYQKIILKKNYARNKE